VLCLAMNRLPILLSLMLALAGCSEPEPEVAPAAAQSTLPELNEVNFAGLANDGTGVSATNTAALPVTVLDAEGLERLRYVLYMFREENGRYPRDLDEAVSAGLLEALPRAPPGRRLTYHPDTGELKLVGGP
jgi:hypothetical protein